MQQPENMATHVVDNTPVAVLYQRYALTIFAYLHLHTSSREDAEDLLLEVFLAAVEYDGLPELAEKEQLAWLRRVAHNKIVDFYRRHSVRSGTVALEDVAEMMYEDETLAPEYVVLHKEEQANLHACVKALPKLQQEVLRMRFANGLRCAEIAVILGKREGAVRMLLSRTLTLLRDIYRKV